jgi:hypothetical protein
VQNAAVADALHCSDSGVFKLRREVLQSDILEVLPFSGHAQQRHAVTLAEAKELGHGVRAGSLLQHRVYLGLVPQFRCLAHHARVTNHLHDTPPAWGEKNLDEIRCAQQSAIRELDATRLDERQAAEKR